jgi:hypothetical protein
VCLEQWSQFLVISCLVFETCSSAAGVVQGTGRPGPSLFTSIRAFLRDGQNNRLLAVPAFLYAINNYLKFAMQLYFKVRFTLLKLAFERRLVCLMQVSSG